MTVLKYWDQVAGTYKPVSGPPGPIGPAGPGVPTGGSIGQALTKNSGVAYDDAWTGPYLALAGGTLTGATTIAPPSGSSPTFMLNKAEATDNNYLVGLTNGSTRWQLILGNNTSEGGGNSGSDFQITRYSDTNVVIDNPLSINRASGVVAIKNQAGVTDGSNAVAGCIGEFLTISGGPYGINSAQPGNSLTNLTITPGDWDVWANFNATLTIANVMTTFQIGLGPNVNAMTSLYQQTQINGASLGSQIASICPTRFNVIANTTIQANIAVVFSSGACNCSATIYARRRR